MPKNEGPIVNPMDLMLLSDGHDVDDEEMTEDQAEEEPEEVTPVPGGFVIGEEDVQESIETNRESGKSLTSSLLTALFQADKGSRRAPCR